MLAITVAVTGCGGGSSAPHTTTTRVASAAVTPPPKCKLSAKQRRLMARLQREIVQMHVLEQPLKTVHKHGPMKLELLLNKFLLSIGVLPVDDRALLIRRAKSAVGLCRDCFDALEAMEPAIETRLGGSPCKPGA